MEKLYLSSQAVKTIIESPNVSDCAGQVQDLFVRRRYFNQWRKRYIVSVAIREHSEHIEEMGLLVKCRRIFLHWKFCEFLLLTRGVTILSGVIILVDFFNQCFWA